MSKTGNIRPRNHNRSRLYKSKWHRSLKNESVSHFSTNKCQLLLPPTCLTNNNGTKTIKLLPYHGNETKSVAPRKIIDLCTIQGFCIDAETLPGILGHAYLLGKQVSGRQVTHLFIHPPGFPQIRSPGTHTIGLCRPGSGALPRPHTSEGQLSGPRLAAGPRKPP